MRNNPNLGHNVIAHHPRGGFIKGVVVKADTELGRGMVLTLHTGYTIVPQDIYQREGQPPTYVTSYCNHAHSMRNGAPIHHQCRHLPVAALRLERAGLYDEAIELLKQRKRIL